MRVARPLHPILALLALPMVSAVEADAHVRPVDVDVVAWEGNVTANGSVDLWPRAGTPSGLGGRAQVEARIAQSVEPSAGGRDAVRAAPADVSVAPAAVGTAVGLTVLVALWASLKHGALVGVGGTLFSRIASHRVLDHEARNRIHECIVVTPGVTIKEISRLLGIGWGTTIYHLTRLEQARLVVSERNRQFRRYYKSGSGLQTADRVAIAELKNPMTELLAIAIADRPGTGQKDLCVAVGISAPVAHKHLVRLEQAQLLTCQRQWRHVRYFPTARLVALLPAASGPVEVKGPPFRLETR